MLSDNIVSRIIEYEAGELDETEILALFQKLVDSGLAWQLQGVYGRTAMRLIDAGLVQPPTEVEPGGPTLTVEVLDAPIVIDETDLRID